MDAFVENLADLFKELSHTKEDCSLQRCRRFATFAVQYPGRVLKEFQLIDRKLSWFYPDQTSKETCASNAGFRGPGHDLQSTIYNL